MEVDNYERAWTQLQGVEEDLTPEEYRDEIIRIWYENELIHAEMSCSVGPFMGGTG